MVLACLQSADAAPQVCRWWCLLPVVARDNYNLWNISICRAIVSLRFPICRWCLGGGNDDRVKKMSKCSCVVNYCQIEAGWYPRRAVSPLRLREPHQDSFRRWLLILLHRWHFPNHLPDLTPGNTLLPHSCERSETTTGTNKKAHKTVMFIISK